MRTWGFVPIRKQKPKQSSPKIPALSEGDVVCCSEPARKIRSPVLRAVRHQAAVAEKPLGYVNAQLCLQAY